ncbi:unnamed protein product [Cylindrotheca closterium]|uniref:Macro domain-containing protein n=1 Tax=Cylindrotheca closterium TaxID=2856 RepID=A0AAD2JHF1_9STRA|nr:unnamed protein product [Cylindrotheca closterium]
MATAWYRPGVVPKIVKSWKVQVQVGIELDVEIWSTTCIVTNFKEARCPTLLNPANPSLSGVSKFPYFPVGGPEPDVLPMKDSHPIMGFVSQWGGMDVGKGMMFAANTVDGMIHLAGGKELAANLKLQLGGKERIVEGQAVWTNGVGDYKHLIHTVPPFFDNSDDDHSENRLLQNCYQTSLSLATDRLPSETDIRIASPLLGAGCRGFPLEEAVFHCAEALSDLNMTISTAVDGGTNAIKGLTLAFGVPSQDIREEMIKAFESRINFTEV